MTKKEQKEQLKQKFINLYSKFDMGLPNIFDKNIFEINKCYDEILKFLKLYNEFRNERIVTSWFSDSLTIYFLKKYNAEILITNAASCINEYVRDYLDNFIYKCMIDNVNFYSMISKLTHYISMLMEPKTYFPYKEQLKTLEWKIKRLEILERDNHKCTQCGSTENLNVHHTYYHNYKRRKLAWEYNDAALITVCEKCHKEIHSITEVEINSEPGSGNIRLSDSVIDKLKEYCHSDYSFERKDYKTIKKILEELQHSKLGMITSNTKFHSFINTEDLLIIYRLIDIKNKIHIRIEAINYKQCNCIDD